MTPDQILNFWFTETSPAQWWKKDVAFDALIRSRFADTHRRATQCELFSWRITAAGRLAEVIVLDQFSRNMFRDSAAAFAHDAPALALAQEAVASGADLALSPEQRAFFYMPYMHSESLQIHREAERLFRLNGIQDNYDFELKHLRIIERFRRYPHRNLILERDSTPEEQEFLQQPGSSF
jgi:uncharacterized protein (DUF924 family)